MPSIRSYCSACFYSVFIGTATTGMFFGISAFAGWLDPHKNIVYVGVCVSLLIGGGVGALYGWTIAQASSPDDRNN